MTYRAYKYRLYPTPDQASWFDRVFAAVRAVYNAALEQRNIYSRGEGSDFFGRRTYFCKARQSRELNFKTLPGRPGLSDDAELSWITDAPKDCIDAALRDLDKAFANFFAGRAGYPTWRNSARNNSLSFKAWQRKRIDGASVARPTVLFGRSCVTIPKIGRVRYVRHRKFYGDPKTVSVVREGREYFAVLTTEQTHEQVTHPNGDTAVGIDMGVAQPLTLSTGEFLHRDERLAQLETLAAKEARKLSVKKRGSNRYKRQKRQLANLRRKQSRRRSAIAHQATTELTRRFNVIAIEDLKVANMTSSAKGDAQNPGKNVRAKAALNREILNVAPYQFRAQLEYKAQRTGSRIITVDPKNTSRMCRYCGNIAAENRKTQSLFSCTACGYQAHADTNAACNILMRALPSAGVLARRKPPSEFPGKSATAKANVSCFQPASVPKITSKSATCEELCGGHPDFTV